MPYTLAAKAAMLDHLGTLTLFVSLHTAAPGETGLNEVTGGTPAYARKSITWSAAAAGQKGASNTPVFDVPASTTLTHAGLWSAVTAGTFYASDEIPAEVFSSQGTYTISEWFNDLLGASS